MKTWLTVAEGAEYAGISRDTIYTACERGELRHARIGGRRAIRFRQDRPESRAQALIRPVTRSRVRP